jgi:integrase
MPHRIAGSPYWWVKISSGGRTVRRSTRTTDRAEAEKIEAEWRRPLEGHSWDKVTAEYLAARGTERAGYAIKGLKPFFSGRPIESITPADIADYKARRRVSVGTLRKELGVMRAAIRYCQRELGWTIPDPTAGRIPDPPPRRVRWLTRDEYRRLIAAAEASEKAPWLRWFIVLAVNTGMRKNEMLGLEWSRVDLEARLVYLEPPDQKARRYDSVPLNEAATAALEALQAVADGPEVFPVASVKRSFKTACRGAGIDDFRIHDLRHTCAAWLVQAGVPLRTVADVLRHSEISTTMIYAHLSPAHAREGVAALDSL